MVIWMMKPNREERPQKIQEIAVKFSSANEDSVETILDESKSFFIEDNLYFIDEHNIKAVDLGLSIMWANSNIGGTLENPKGELCEWRDTNDIIRHRLGSNWKLPKQKDWEELVSKCEWTNVFYVNIDKQLDIEGFQITGPNGNSIFLPKTGEREKSGIVYCYGCYWTSGKDDELNPYYFCYDDEDETSQFVTVNPCDYLRLAVRPVCNVCSSPDMNGCNIQLDYDIIDSNLLDNLCRKYNHQSHTEQEVFVEDISKETNNSIGIVLIHLGWLMKEGKVNDSWNLYINNTRINVELVGFSAGDVFQVLASASYPISIDNIIEENSKQNKFAENPLLGEGSMEATLLGLGWLMKEGKLLFENNLISLS